MKHHTADHTMYTVHVLVNIFNFVLRLPVVGLISSRHMALPSGHSQGGCSALPSGLPDMVIVDS